MIYLYQHNSQEKGAKTSMLPYVPWHNDMTGISDKNSLLSKHGNNLLSPLFSVIKKSVTRKNVFLYQRLAKISLNSHIFKTHVWHKNSNSISKRTPYPQSNVVVAASYCFLFFLIELCFLSNMSGFDVSLRPHQK